MASKQLLSIIIIILHLTLNSPLFTVAQCPYPCYPPPTSAGGGNTPQTANYPPPAAVYTPPSTVYTPPSSVYPYNPPNNPTSYGGAQPPPDPVVPWFPYYYKDPPRNPNKSSSADLPRGSTVVIFLIYVLAFELLCMNLLVS